MSLFHPNISQPIIYLPYNVMPGVNHVYIILVRYNRSSFHHITIYIQSVINNMKYSFRFLSFHPTPDLILNTISLHSDFTPFSALSSSIVVYFCVWLLPISLKRFAIYPPHVMFNILYTKNILHMELGEGCLFLVYNFYAF